MLSYFTTMVEKIICAGRKIPRSVGSNVYLPFPKTVEALYSCSLASAALLGKNISPKGDQPRDLLGASWRRCISCSLLWVRNRIPSHSRKIYHRSDRREKSQGWNFDGTTRQRSQGIGRRSSWRERPALHLCDTCRYCTPVVAQCRRHCAHQSIHWLFISASPQSRIQQKSAGPYIQSSSSV